MLVSVEHGHERFTLAVPVDVPVELLLPLLVHTCGGDPSASWTLVPRGGSRIDPGRTLREAGIWPGTLLALRMTSPGERDEAGWRGSGHVARLERALAGAPPGPGAVVALTSSGPGRGTTTVTTLLAALLARLLPQPPLAIDGDLRSRSLSQHLAPRLQLSSETYTEVIEGRLRLDEQALAAQGPYGVALLPAPERPAGTPDAAACTTLVTASRRPGRVLLLDCPAGFRTSWGQAAWAAADQVVLVVDGRADDLAALAPAVTTLAGAGVGVVVVVNRARSVRARTAAGLPGPVVALPNNPVAAARLRAGQLTWQATPRPWRRALAHLASALAAA